MRIDDALIQHIARLGRLHASEEERRAYLSHLNAILDYMEKIERLDTAGVEPLFHALEQTDVFREDQPGASLPVEEVLSNAPDAAMPFFKVPQVIE